MVKKRKKPEKGQTSKIQGAQKTTPLLVPDLSTKPHIDDIDIKLLQILQDNGRMSNIDIAQKLNMSEATVRRRINNLVENDMIRGFSALLNYKKMGKGVKASIYAKVMKRNLEEVADMLKKSENSCTVYQVIGNYNLYCELLFYDLLELQSFIDSLSQMDTIENLEYHIVTKTYKPCPWSGI